MHLLALVRREAGERSVLVDEITALDERLAAARAAAERIVRGSSDAELAWVSEIVARLGSSPPELLFSPEVLVDLYLLAACRLGNPDALRALDDKLRGVAGPLIRRYRLDSARADEVLQQLRVRLMVAGDDGRSRLDAYAGRGPLLAWLRTACARTILNLLRDEGAADRREDGLLRVLEDAVTAPPASDAASLRPELEQVFAAALAALPRRDRLLLKQHYVDGLSTRELGTLHAVHSVTALRWLNAAQDRLVADLRARVQARFGVGSSECESLLRELRGGGLEATLRSLLTSR